MGFRDGIVDKTGALLRAVVQSPNYLAGALGWKIGQDGSAEFNKAIFRGELEIDQYPTDIYQRALSVVDKTNPNVYPDGLIKVLIDTLGIRTTRLQLFTAKDVDPLHSPSDEIRIGQYSSPSTFFPHGTNDGPGIAIQHGYTSKGLAIGAGPMGKYYGENVSLDSTVLANNAQVQLTNFTPLRIHSDYDSQFNLATGEWTCPVSGYYDVTLHAFIGAWVAGSTLLLSVLRNAVLYGQNDAVSQFGIGHITVVNAYFTAGDVVTFGARQLTGASKSVGISPRSYINIARRN